MQGDSRRESTPKVRAPIPRTRGVLSDAPLGRAPTPSTTPLEVFRDFNKEARRRGNSSLSHAKDLASLFQPPTDIMFTGTFEEACVKAKSQRKWLLVNILNEEFSSQQLNRDTWSNDTLKRFVDEKFVFWQKYNDGEDSRTYVIFYEVVAYPHIAIIDPRTRELMLCWGSVVPPEDLLRELRSFCADRSIGQDTPHARAAPHITNASKAADLTEEEQFQLAISASLGLNQEIAVKEPPPKRTSLRELSEDEQLALAIKASLEEQHHSEPAKGPGKRERVGVDAGGEVYSGKEKRLCTADLQRPGDSDGDSVAILHQSKDKMHVGVDAEERGLKWKESSSSTGEGPSLPHIDGERTFIIRVRQTDGEVLKGSFCPKHTLRHVKRWVDENRTDGDVPCELMTTYPRKVYADEAALSATLESQGLNRATLILRPADDTS